MLKIAYSPTYHHILPLGHRFPMSKYPFIKKNLLENKTVAEQNFFEPKPFPLPYFKGTHSSAYIQKLASGKLERLEERKIGFPFSPALLEREILIMSGTVQAAEYALQYGASFNIAGGTHHSFKDRGEGFCIFNDIAVASNHLLNEGLADKILVIDLDVHQGNGTASIFKDVERVFTFSMHGGKNYPFKKEQSDLDIELENGIEDEAYLDLLSQALDDLFPIVKPDFVFYQSGVDILKTDKLGKLGLSRDGCKMRDEMVIRKCHQFSVPFTAVMGGGYSPNIDDIVEAHCNTYRLTQKIIFGNR